MGKLAIIVGELGNFFLEKINHEQNILTDWYEIGAILPGLLEIMN